MAIPRRHRLQTLKQLSRTTVFVFTGGRSFRETAPCFQLMCPTFLIPVLALLFCLHSSGLAQQAHQFRMDKFDGYVAVNPETNVLNVTIGFAERDVGDLTVWLLQTNGTVLLPTFKHPPAGKKTSVGIGKSGSDLWFHLYSFPIIATNGEAAVVLKLNWDYRVFPMEGGKFVESRPPSTVSSAKEIAKQHLQQKGIVFTGSEPTIAVRAGFWIVTFPRKLPDGTRGGSFIAQVWVDGKTSEVRELVLED